MSVVLLLASLGLFPGIGVAHATAPTTRNGTGSCNEDSSVTVKLSASDRDGDALTYYIVDNPTNGSVSLSTNRATYTPNANWNGTDTFTFKVRDSTMAESAVATVTITVNPVADAPTATAQSLNVTRNSTQTITLTGSDPDGDALTCSIASAPSNGSASETSECVISYRPTRNYTGSDSFTFAVSDGTSTSAAATVSINVTATNTDPVAASGSTSGTEDTSVNVKLTATDADGDGLSYAIVRNPSNGSVRLKGNRATYTPDADFSGADTFTWSATDARGAVSNVATATVNVAAVNDAPVVTDRTSATAEDTDDTITLTATDVDSPSPYTYAITNAPTRGTATISRGVVTYSPNADWSGSDSFRYTASDSSGATSNEGTVTINVSAVNDAPVAPDQTVEAVAGTPKRVKISATDVDSSSLSYRITGSPSNGVASYAAGVITYTANDSFSGTDTVVWAASDGSLSDPGTITFNVSQPNHAPTTTATSANVAEDSSVAITLPATDSDGDALSFTLIAAPTRGSVTIAGDVATYTPGADYYGGDSFRFRANDGTADSNVSEVTVTVTPVNDAPVAGNVSATTPEDTTVTVRPSATDIDSRSGFTFTVATQPTRGSALVSGANFLYTPDDDFNGTDTFTYTANDGEAVSAPATVTVTVTAVNDAPLAPMVSANTTEGEAITIRHAYYDADGDTVSITLDEGAHHGEVRRTSAGFRYTPDEDFVGQDHFTFYVSDGTLTSEVGTVRVNVNPPSTWSRPDMVQFGTNKVQYGRDATDPNDMETSSYQFRPSTLEDWMTDIGFQSFRQPIHGDLNWGAVELGDGNYIFNEAEQIIPDEYLEPLPTLFSIQYASPTPPWCTDPEQFQKYMNESSYDYLETVGESYGEYVNWWELGNEMFHWVSADPPVGDAALEKLPDCYPLDGYQPAEQGVFLEEQARYMKSVVPGARTVLPSIKTGSDSTHEWITEMLGATTGTDWFDAINYHHYDEWQLFYTERAEMNELFEELGIDDKLVKLTETGSSSDPEETSRTNYPNSDETECSDIFRFFAISMSSGDSLFIWHTFVGMSDDSDGEGLPGMELVTTSGDWKPAAYTMRLLGNTLVPMIQAADYSRHGVYAFQFYNGSGGERWVLWGTGTVAIPERMSEYTSVYPGGSTTFTWTPVSPGDQVRLTATPILIR